MSIRRLTRTPDLFVTLAFAALIGLALTSHPLAQKPAGRTDQAPRFEVEPLWPKPLPNHWVLGSIGGIGVDEQDHVWILQRGAATLAENFKQLDMTPPWAMCCASAPAVARVRSGRQSAAALGRVRPRRLAMTGSIKSTGSTIDYKGNVWLGGGAGGDSHLLKFTKDGKFLMQVGKRYARQVTDAAPAAPAAAAGGGRGGRGAGGPARVYKANSLDMENFGRPAKLVVDPKTERGVRCGRLPERPHRRHGCGHREVQALLGSVWQQAR